MAFITHAQLRAFHAVATERSFTKAARALRVSQPAVTIQVKALEESCGAALLDRRGRQVVPTELGEGLLAITRRIFGLEQEADEMLAAAGELRSGHLKVGADGPYFVMELLAAFIGRYPGVRVTVAMGNSQSVVQDLVDYRADVAVLAWVGDDRRFHSIPYSRQPVVVFVPRDHEWAGRSAIRLAELEGRAMVLREVGSTTRQILERALGAAGVSPRVVMEIGSREALREAVAAGLGVGVVSRAELGGDARLWPLEIADARLESWEFVVCLKERRNLRTVKAFLSLVEDARASRSDAA
ncbi:MAG: LysR substrate-binding domain-containing protein [Alphaproteobacteria bacterium]